MNWFDVEKDKFTDDELKLMFTNIPQITNYMCVDKDTQKKYFEMKQKVVK